MTTAKIITEFEMPETEDGVYHAILHALGGVEAVDMEGRDDAVYEAVYEKAFSDWPKLVRALYDINQTVRRMMGDHDPKALLAELANVANISAEAILAATQPEGGR